ncbi:MAG: hypothetical protein H0V73_07360 [Chloroflexi bacterium]|nr:hypothetical protein [Chloroflexota bacterium]
MAQLQEVWNKFNPRERLTAIGAGLIILGWIVGLVSYGVGSSTLALIGALAVLGILYVKYSPGMKVNWPADVSLIILVIGAIVALLVLVDALQIVRFLGLASYFGVGLILTLLLTVAGAALMVWGAWQEYQVVKPTIPNFGGSGTSTAGAPPPAAPIAPTEPPAAPAPGNIHEAPPAPQAPPAPGNIDEAPPA